MRGLGPKTAMEKATAKAMNSGEGEALLGEEYEIVTTQKHGILFIEARMRDDLELEVDIATVTSSSCSLIFYY